MSRPLVRLSDGETFRRFGIEKPNASEGSDTEGLVNPEVAKKSFKVDRRFTNSINSIKEYFPPLSEPQHRLRGIDVIKSDKVYRYDNIIIKLADTSLDEVPLFREAVIGLILNETFSHPFVHTIGYLSVESCQLPDKEGPCMYLYTEEVPGDTLADWIENNFDYEEFRKILLKIFGALYEANQELDFTHYDLHPGNVIITYEGLEPVIIDLDAAHIKYEGGHLGRADFEEFGVLNWTSFWIYDVFKLLIICLDRLVETKDELPLKPSDLEEFNSAIKMVLKLLTYFNESIDLAWMHQYLEVNPNGEVYMTYYNKNARFSDFMQYAKSVI